MRSKIASRVAQGLFGLVVLSLAGILAASHVGLFSSRHHAALDAQDYVGPVPEQMPPAGGIDALDFADAFDAGNLQSRLDRLQGTGTISFSVYDLAGNQVASRQPHQAMIPASSMKTLTSLAALDAYGPSHRFTTYVVSSPSGVVIVGGGDPFLTAKTKFHPWQASAIDLADQVAEALKRENRTSITLGYDASLLVEAEWNPGWNGSAVAGDMTPISALSIDPPMARNGDPAKSAAGVFAQLLSDRGITVSATQAVRAPDDAPVLAEVDSLPLGLIVQRTMEVSHNYAAEVMFYHVAVAAGHEGSFTNARKDLETYLQSAGLWEEGMAVMDGSGLARGNKIPASVLARAVRTALSDPRLADVIRGMPVAGVEGTLSNRFDDDNEAGGRGVVHAKTGTLNHVRSLTGVVSTQSGHVLVFSFMVNDITQDAATVNWLDQAATILATS